jgi:hypothetical protein
VRETEISIMSTQPDRQPVDRSPKTLVSTHDVEHPHAVGRRVKAALTLVGAAAAGVLALILTSPAAIADTVDLPEIPLPTGPETVEGSFGLPPLFMGQSLEANASYTDLLGVQISSATPLQFDTWEFPGAFNPSISAESVTGDVDAVLAPFNGGDVGGDTSSYIEMNPGLFNLYEVTPFLAADGAHVLNYDDAVVFDPTGIPLFGETSGIEFGIQYLDLPSALTPVDELNFLGSGGEILFSLPVTGDLLSLF